MEDRAVEQKLKRDIWITGIGMFAAAVCIPALFLGMMHLPTDLFPPLVLLYVYILLCLFTLVWGSVQVFWELPGKKRRLFLFLLWLILYPAACAGWYFLCGVGFFLIYHVH